MKIFSILCFIALLMSCSSAPSKVEAPQMPVLKPYNEVSKPFSGRLWSFWNTTCAKKSSGISCWGGNLSDLFPPQELPIEQHGPLAIGTKWPKVKKLRSDICDDITSFSRNTNDNLCVQTMDDSWVCTDLNGTVRPFEKKDDFVKVGDAKDIRLNSPFGWVLRQDGNLFKTTGNIEEKSWELLKDPVHTQVKTISIADSSSCLLIENGEVLCSPHLLGGEWEEDPFAKPQWKKVPGLTDVEGVEMGALHACAKTTQGQVYCWGDNMYGQLGDGTLTTRKRPVLVKNLPKVDKLTLGSDQSCAITTKKELYCWGIDDIRFHYSEWVDHGTLPKHHQLPRRMPINEPIDQVSLSANTSCAKTVSGNVYCWGMTQFEQFKDYLPDFNYEDKGNVIPIKMSFLNHVKQINVSRSFGCVILEDDRIGCWGDQSVLYRATQEIQPPTRSVLTSETKDFFYLPTQPNTNLLSFCKQQNDGQILCSQVRHHLDNNDLLPVEEKKSFVSLSPKEEVEQFQTNGCALTKDHIITCLTETDSKSKTWVRKPELGEFVSISKGFDGDCAIDTAGNVFCSVTEYGNAPYHPFANLKKVQGLSQIIQIDVREKTHCAIDVNQDLYCWNRMEPNKPFSKPIKVLSQVVQVGSTWMSGPDLCAIKVDGSVKCIEVRSSSFDWEKEFEASQWVTRLPSNDPAHILSCGTNHCCVMTKSEKVFCAGNNDDGQLGISGSGGGSFFHEVKLE